jgi:hypothetical protein
VRREWSIGQERERENFNMSQHGSDRRVAKSVASSVVCRRDACVCVSCPRPCLAPLLLLITLLSPLQVYSIGVILITAWSWKIFCSEGISLPAKKLFLWGWGSYVAGGVLWLTDWFLCPLTQVRWVIGYE